MCVTGCAHGVLGKAGSGQVYSGLWVTCWLKVLASVSLSLSLYVCVCACVCVYDTR